MNTLGERVTKARELRRDKATGLPLSQSELARMVSRASGMNVKQQSISQLEEGLVKNPRYLSELANVLGVSFNWLKSGKGAMEAETSGKSDRQDLHAEIDRLPEHLLDKARHLLEYVKDTEQRPGAASQAKAVRKKS